MQVTIEKISSDSNGGVVSVRWSMSASKDGMQIKDIGVAKFNPDPSAPDFIPFAQLTEADVVAWVSKNINIEAVEKRLNDAVASAQLQSTAFPWSQGV